MRTRKTVRTVNVIMLFLVIIAYAGYHDGISIAQHALTHLLFILVIVNILVTLFLTIPPGSFLTQIAKLKHERAELKKDIADLSQQKKILTFIKDRVDFFEQRDKLKKDIQSSMSSQNHLHMLLKNYEEMSEDLYWLDDKVDRIILTLKRITDLDKSGLVKEMKRRRIPRSERVLRKVAVLFNNHFE